jgi:hypothetical protein
MSQNVIRKINIPQNIIGDMKTSIKNIDTNYLLCDDSTKNNNDYKTLIKTYPDKLPIVTNTGGACHFNPVNQYVSCVGYNGFTTGDVIRFGNTGTMPTNLFKSTVIAYQITNVDGWNCKLDGVTFIGAEAGTIHLFKTFKVPNINAYTFIKAL